MAIATAFLQPTLSLVLICLTSVTTSVFLLQLLLEYLCNIYIGMYVQAATPHAYLMDGHVGLVSQCTCMYVCLQCLFDLVWSTNSHFPQNSTCREFMFSTSSISSTIMFLLSCLAVWCGTCFRCMLVVFCPICIQGFEYPCVLRRSMRWDFLGFSYVFVSLQIFTFRTPPKHERNINKTCEVSCTNLKMWKVCQRFVLV